MTSRSSSRLKFTSKRLKSKEIGITNLQEIFSLYADGPQDQAVHAQRQIVRHQRVESFDAVEVPSTLGEARSDLFQCARDNSLQEGSRVAECSDADRDAVEAGEDFCSVSGEFIYRHHVTPREHLYVPKASSFPILSNYSEADKTQFGQFGREQYR